jgi:putative oxidoreductase
MSVEKIVDLIIAWPGRLLGSLQSAFLAAIRIWVGWEFFKSGWLKVSNWDSTLFLFREEYHVPFLPSNLAAVLGAGGELVFPVMLWLGIASRLGALGLSAVNAMAVIAYAHVLLGEGFEAALGQHYLWGLALLTVAIVGPGSVSVDQWLVRRKPHDLVRPTAAAV